MSSKYSVFGYLVLGETHLLDKRVRGISRQAHTVKRQESIPVAELHSRIFSTICLTRLHCSLMVLAGWFVLRRKHSLTFLIRHRSRQLLQELFGDDFVHGKRDVS